MINNADATIVCTEDRIEQISGSKPSNLTVVHNTPAIERKVKVNEIYTSNSCLRLGYVGGLEKKRFINQIVEIISRNKNFKLSIAGTPGDAVETVKKYSIAKNIDYYGIISYEDAFQLYKETDIIIAIYNPDHPNHKYSAPNKVYEAMILGKAIIVAKGSGIDKLATEYDIGYVINYNAESLKQKLKEINEDRVELQQKKLNSYRAYSKYSWSEMQERIIDLYKKINN